MTSVSSIPSVDNVNIVPQPQVKTAYVQNGIKKTAEQADTFTGTMKGSIPTVGLFEGLPFVKFLMRNKKTGKVVTDQMKALGQINQKAVANLVKGEGSLPQRIINYLSNVNQSKEIYSGMRKAAKAENSVLKLTKKIAKKGGSEKTITKLTLAAEKKAASAAAQKEAINVSLKAAEGTGKSTLKSVIKASGAKVMLAFSGILEFATEVLPTFKELGAEKGMKQLGKSAVKVAGDTVGFIAGEQAGLALGTAIGTALFPGVGTAIGAAVGFIGGLAGSFLAGKITKAVVGDSEREIAKQNAPMAEQQTDTYEDIQGIENNPFVTV